MKNSLSGKTVDEMTGSREALQEAAFPLAFISRLRMATDGAGVTGVSVIRPVAGSMPRRSASAGL